MVLGGNHHAGVRTSKRTAKTSHAQRWDSVGESVAPSKLKKVAAEKPPPITSSRPTAFEPLMTQPTHPDLPMPPPMSPTNHPAVALLVPPPMPPSNHTDVASSPMPPSNHPAVTPHIPPDIVHPMPPSNPPDVARHMHPLMPPFNHPVVAHPMPSPMSPAFVTPVLPTMPSDVADLPMPPSIPPPIVPPQPVPHSNPPAKQSKTYECAGLHLCGMKNIDITIVGHRCMNCSNAMHGVFCGKLFCEMGPDINIPLSSLSAQGKNYATSCQALICAICIDTLNVDAKLPANAPASLPSLLMATTITSTSTSPSNGHLDNNVGDGTVMSLITTSKMGATLSSTARTIYHNLPKSDLCCIRIDNQHGLFYECKHCGIVKVRIDRPYTMSRWNDHVKSDSHILKAKRYEHDTALLQKKKSSGPLSKMEMMRLTQLKPTQKGLLTFFPMQATKKKSNSANHSITSSKELTCEEEPIGGPVSNSPSDTEKCLLTCQGVLAKFSKEPLQSYLRAYHHNAAIMQTSKYKMAFFQQNTASFSQVFSKDCKGTHGISRVRGIFSCDACNKLRIDSGAKITQNIKIRGLNILCAEENSRKLEISPCDHAAMIKFSKTSNALLSGRGLTLKNTIILQNKYYNGVKKSIANSKTGFVPGVDKFLTEFNNHYTSGKSDFKDSLLVNLMKCYVAKVNGCSNPVMATKVLNFFMAMAAGGDRRSFEYVSGNLCGVSLRHVKRVISSKRGPPFMNMSTNEIVALVKSQIALVRKNSGNSTRRVVFSLGIDATVLVKAWQYSKSLEAIIGGASPNHCIDVNGLTPEEVLKLLEECVDGRHGAIADEVKVAVLSYQNTPANMCPYFVLVGLPQTLNQSNDFGEMVINSCNTAVLEDGNSAIINESTDGVSCEVEWNKKLTLDYLDGKKNYISLPDTNHNVKNSRYQLIGGSSAATIGSFVFDPWLLKEAGVAKELIRVEDYASDVCVLRLASASTVKKIIDLDSKDTGNVSVTILSLMFMRMRSYAVNSRTATWDERATMSYAALLWFTSFHTSGSTMMANKRNMILETVGVLFLVTRSDVSQPRRCTSESNEHTYGCWRQILREFNMEQLIRIVCKNKIRNDAIFESNLVTSRSRNTFKGYQQSFPEFIESLKKASASLNDCECGPVEIDLTMPAANQLWEEVDGIMKATNAWMKPFLAKYGVEEGNGLSPFAVDIDSTSDLRKIIGDFFKTPKKDLRDNYLTVSILNDIDDDGTNFCETEKEATVPPAIIAYHAEDISKSFQHLDAIHCEDDASCDDDNGNEDIIRDTTLVELSTLAVEQQFADGDVSNGAFLEFKKMLMCDDTNVGPYCLRVIELLQLGKIEKGSSKSDAKSKSLKQRWFTAKGKKGVGQHNSKNDIDPIGEVWIERDSLITMKCKRGKGNETIEYYRVLAVFTKYYNKWFVATDESRFIWNKDSKKVRILARMMSKCGSSYHEMKLEKDGTFGPQSVFCTKYMCDILSVDANLIGEF